MNDTAKPQHRGRAPPILVWGWESQEVSRAASSSISRRERSFFVRLSRFFVPTAIQSTRRAQPRSRLAVAVRVQLAPLSAGHALTAASTARGWGVGTIWSRAERRDVILDWAVNVECECANTASPCIRSGTRPRYPDLSCTGESKAQQRRDPSTKTVWVDPGWVTVTRLSWVTSAVMARALQRLGRSAAPFGTTPVVR
jgi:hypothetical protein